MRNENVGCGVTKNGKIFLKVIITVKQPGKKKRKKRT